MEEPRLAVAEWLVTAGVVWRSDVGAGFTGTGFVSAGVGVGVGTGVAADGGAPWLVVGSTRVPCARYSTAKRPAAAAATRPPPTKVSAREVMNQGRGRSIGSGDANSGCSLDHARSGTYGWPVIVGAAASNSVAAR